MWADHSLSTSLGDLDRTMVAAAYGWKAGNLDAPTSCLDLKESVFGKASHFLQTPAFDFTSSMVNLRAVLSDNHGILSKRGLTLKTSSF